MSEPRLSKEPFRGANLLLWIIALLFFTYVLLRAVLLSYTFDEISSFWIVQDRQWYKIGTTANNHFLNTFFMKITSTFFGTSEFALRLPNVLAYAFYILYSLKIGGRVPHKFGKFITLIFLSSMPFLIDFFSLARGYGLSLTLMLASIYYLIQLCEKKQNKSAVLSLLFASLAVLSNFTLLNYYLSDLLVILLFTALHKSSIKGKMKKVGLLLLLVFPFILVILPLLLQLKNGNQLFFGGRIGFLTDTINSLGRCFAYFQPYRGFAVEVFRTLFFLTITFALINIVLALKQKKQSTHSSLGLLYLLCVAAPIAQHLLLGTHYPIERTALLYFPLMALVLIFGIDGFKAKGYSYFNYIITAGFLFHFLITLNFTHTYSWRYDSGTKQAISRIKELEKDNKKSVRIGVNYLFTPSVEFYKTQMNFENLVVNQVTEIGEFQLKLEEFDPEYYGMDNYFKMELNEVDLDRLISPQYDYMYLDNFLMDELKRQHIPFTVIQDYPFSKSTLITFLKN